MSLPRMDCFDTVDLSLRRTLKNWVGRKQPPIDGKSRLLQAAASEPQSKASKFLVYLAALSLEHDTDLYLYRLKMTDISCLRISAFGMC